MTDILMILLLLGGALLLVVVEFCTPTFGLLAAGALACLAAMVYYCFKINYVFGLVGILAVLVGMPIYIMWLAKILPDTRFGRRLGIGKAPKGTGEGVPEAGQFSALMGADGVALSPLRPTGAVEIGGERIIASAESAWIPSGSKVRVVKVGEMNVVVRQVAPPPG